MSYTVNPGGILPTNRTPNSNAMPALDAEYEMDLCYFFAGVDVPIAELVQSERVAGAVRTCCSLLLRSSLSSRMKTMYS
jgi:hypothetical protein